MTLYGGYPKNGEPKLYASGLMGILDRLYVQKTRHMVGKRTQAGKLKIQKVNVRNSVGQSRTVKENVNASWEGLNKDTYPVLPTISHKLGDIIKHSDRKCTGVHFS